jgi:predicted DNA-binding transcriptional regulator AlpA
MSAKKTPAKKAQTITPEIAEKLRAAQISNIVKKVRDGKTLTAAEGRMLEVAASPDDERDLVTLTRISDLFQVSRKTIYEWRKQGRDIPSPIKKKEDLAAWRGWFAANPSAGHYDGKPRRDRETLLCEKLEVDIKIGKTRLDEMIGELVPVGEVRQSITRVVSAARAQLLKLSSDVPPRLAGLNEAEMQTIIREEITEILTRLSDETSDLYADKN